MMNGTRMRNSPKPAGDGRVTELMLHDLAPARFFEPWRTKPTEGSDEVTVGHMWVMIRTGADSAVVATFAATDYSDAKRNAVNILEASDFPPGHYSLACVEGWVVKRAN